MIKRADAVEVGAEYRLMKELTTRARQTLDSEEVQKLPAGTVVVILQSEVEGDPTDRKKEKLVRVRTLEGWLTYRKSWLQKVDDGGGGGGGGEEEGAGGGD
jgi:hypothetical protein